MKLTSLFVIALFILIDLNDLYSYLRRPADYHLGSEMAGFRYSDRLHFIGTTALTIVIGIVGIAAPRLTNSERVATAIRCAAAVLLVVLSFALASK